MLAAACTAVATPAAASAPTSEEAARTYIRARAAAMSGEYERSARLLGVLADANESDTTIARIAVSEAIGAGDMRLALRLARRLKVEQLPVDARLLLAADELKRNRTDWALHYLSTGSDETNLRFFDPLVRAWGAAERKDLPAALHTLDAIPTKSVLGPYRDENRAFILLKFRRSAEAESFARRAIGNAGGRESRLRLALADAFLAAGDRQRALIMVEGMGTDAASARQRLMTGKPSGLAIGSGADAFAEILMALVVDLNRLNNRSLPVGMAQIARYADPDNSAAAILLALLLSGRDRPDDALAVLRTVRENDPLIGQARDTAARILSDEERFDEALALAQPAASSRTAGAGDFVRLGDVLNAMERHNEAADAYGRAVAIAAAQGLQGELWTLHLLRATALESANRWPEAKQALQAALALQPEQPLVLNFLGYAKLERGEDLDVAEAMIRKASALAPEDASITDSLGWALYKRGRIDDAIETLQRAAAADPQQAEIHEHLGDALFRAGRRYEARFAWNAALITAEDDIAARVRRKLEIGLTPATAAP